MTSFHATLFEDLDGDGALGPGDRTLDRAFGETEEPAWYIEISGLEAPPGQAAEKLRVLAEVETTLGNSRVVFRL